MAIDKEKILQILREDSSGLRAVDIAERMGNKNDSAAVGHMLYTQLKDCCRVDSEYRWYLKDSQEQPRYLLKDLPLTPNSPIPTTMSFGVGFGSSHKAKKPVPEDFSLTQDKLRLLENPQKYNELRSRVNECRDNNKESTQKASLIIIGLILLLIVCVWVAKNCDYDDAFEFILFVIKGVFLSIISVLPFVIIYIILKGSSDVDPNPIIDGWRFVVLSDDDYKNYHRYQVELDDFEKRPIPVDWKDIIFKDGLIQVTVQKHNTTFDFPCSSRNKFNQYKNRVKLPDVEVYRHKGKYDFVDRIRIASLIATIVGLIDKEEAEYRRISNRFYDSNADFGKARAHQSEIRGELALTRSEYLRYLTEHQASGKDIIPALECVSHASHVGIYPMEKAYIFTLEQRDKLIIVYENAHEATTSIVAKVEDGAAYFDCIATIYNYMRSTEKNKREQLQWKHNIGDYRVSSAFHQEFECWRQSLYCG